jgi:hypothetical protein
VKQSSSEGKNGLEKAGKGYYHSEDAFAKEFCSLLECPSSPWGKVDVLREFNYVRGRTDVIAIDENDNVFAFELKLTKWSEAVHQAYRNTCFAHGSYVILPEDTAGLASKYFSEFRARSVGLCSIINGSIHVILPAVHQKPIQPWLTGVAVARSRDQAA